MIIVSQDKSVIVNFNNVEAIEIGNVEENQCKGTIYARLGSDYFYKIGEYKTEERAKEVLQVIIRLLENSFRVDYQEGRSDYPIETLHCRQTIFHMPKE